MCPVHWCLGLLHVALRRYHYHQTDHPLCFTALCKNTTRNISVSALYTYTCVLHLICYKDRMQKVATDSNSEFQDEICDSVNLARQKLPRVRLCTLQQSFSTFTSFIAMAILIRHKIFVYNNVSWDNEHGACILFKQQAMESSQNTIAVVQTPYGLLVCPLSSHYAIAML